MAKFLTPRLLIADYYDSLVNQLDIYTEGLLSNYTHEDFLEREPEPAEPEPNDKENVIEVCGERFHTDPYSCEFKYTRKKAPNVKPGVTKAIDYINQVRARAIDEIRQVQKHNLDMYEVNKDMFKITPDEMNKDSLNELVRQLFVGKFCFLINISKPNEDEALFKICTVITDFYVNQFDRNFLNQILFSTYNVPPGALTSLMMDNFNGDFTNSSLLMHLAKDYIKTVWGSHKYGIEIIEINKCSLLGVEKVIIEYHGFNSINLDSQTCDLDLSCIKSLTVRGCLQAQRRSNWQYALVDLSALSNLEYVTAVDLRLTKTSLNGLKNLIKPEFIDCESSQFDESSFSELTNVQLLSLERLNSPVYFKKLKNLKWLSLRDVKDLSYIKYLNPDLKYLELCSSKIVSKSASYFFKLTNITNLIHLNLFGNELTWLEKMSFAACPNLKYLNLSNNKLGTLNFLECDFLRQLEHLDVTENEILSIREDNFVRTMRLKRLILSQNPISGLESYVFRYLRSLEVLKANSNSSCCEFKLGRNCLNGLSNLKELQLNSTTLTRIDLDVFKHTPKLESLELRNLQTSLKTDGSFAHISNLKSLDLRNKDRNIQHDQELLASLRNANTHLKILV